MLVLIESAIFVWLGFSLGAFTDLKINQVRWWMIVLPTAVLFIVAKIYSR